MTLGPERGIQFGVASPVPSPINFTATGGDAQVQLEWTGPPNVDIEIYRSTDDDFSGASIIATLPSSELSLLDTGEGGLSPDTTFYYWARSVSDLGNSGYVSASATTNP